MDINDCKCGSFAIQTMTMDGRFQVHCYNEHADRNGHDCEEFGPITNDDVESISRWNSGERIAPPR